MRPTAGKLSLLLLLAENSYLALASSNNDKDQKRPSPGCSRSNQNSTNPSLTSLSESLEPGTERNFTLPQTPNTTSSSLSRAVVGAGRPYTLFVPSGYDAAEPAPLIVSLHGAGRTARWQAELDGLAPHEGDDDGSSAQSLQVPGFNDGRHLVVYPQSTGTTPDDMFWEGYPGLAAGIDDVGYVLAVLDAVGRDACVDEARVYAVGKSQGGGLVNVLACDADGRVDGRFAALASVSGAYYVPGVAPEDCRPDTVEIPGCGGGDQKKKDNGRGGMTPFLAFHGGSDTTIAYAGGERRGYCLPSVQHWVDEWVRREGLREEPLEVRNLTGDATAYIYGDGERGDGGGVFTFVYDGDRIGHDWPATFGNTDNEDHGTGPASFNASGLIMDFFRDHSLSYDEAPTPTSTPTTGAPTESPVIVNPGKNTAMSIQISTAGHVVAVVIGVVWAIL